MSLPMLLSILYLKILVHSGLWYKNQERNLRRHQNFCTCAVGFYNYTTKSGAQIQVISSSNTSTYIISYMYQSFYCLYILYLLIILTANKICCGLFPYVTVCISYTERRIFLMLSNRVEKIHLLPTRAPMRHAMILSASACAINSRLAVLYLQICYFVVYVDR